MRDDEDDDDDDDGDDEAGELVEKGNFRVDPTVAAEKLRDFQLPDAKAFLVPWLRAAVAAGASEVTAGAVDGALEFAFDGEAPDPAVLGDLTAGLLQEDHGPAARHLAFGALALRRLQPDAVLASREGEKTVLRVRWRRSAPTSAALGRLRAAYGMTDVPLTVEGERVPDPARAGTPVKAWGGGRGRTVVLEDALTPGDGRLRLYHLGALVETLPVPLSGHFTAYASHDRFTLSLSQSSVVRDKRYEKIRRRLERLRRRLAQREPTLPSKVRTWATVAGGVAAAGAAVLGAFHWLFR